MSATPGQYGTSSRRAAPMFTVAVALVGSGVLVVTPPVPPSALSIAAPQVRVVEDVQLSVGLHRTGAG